MSTVFDSALLANLSGEESKRISRLLQKGITIPPQPRVVQELRQSLAAGVSDVRVLARIISQDPGIVAMLFKVSQSVVFRRFKPFHSIENVLMAMGLQQAGNFVSAVALTGLLPAKHNRKAFEAYWARSQAISELAMLIADERVQVCNVFPDQACLAGIFHDCGVAVLMQRFSTYCKDMRLDISGGWVDLHAEDARFNADHCVIGYLVGRHWQLPDFICDAIRYHHDIGQMEPHAARTMVAILQLANYIYYSNQHLDYPDWDSIKDAVMDELGLGEETLPEFMDIIRERYHSAV